MASEVFKRAPEVEPCPRCDSIAHVRRKLVLVERSDAGHSSSNWRVSCPCDGDLSVSDLLPEYVAAGAAAQFIEGLYCEQCETGYIPDSMAKPEAPSYRATEGGWRRVFSDGTLGPVLERMADDPELHIKENPRNAI